MSSGLSTGQHPTHLIISPPLVGFFAMWVISLINLLSDPFSKDQVTSYSIPCYRLELLPRNLEWTRSENNIIAATYGARDRNDFHRTRRCYLHFSFLFFHDCMEGLSRSYIMCDITTVWTRTYKWMPDIKEICKNGKHCHSSRFFFLVWNTAFFIKTCF